MNYRRFCMLSALMLSICLLMCSCVSINSTIPAVATDPAGNVVTKADPVNGYQVNYYNLNTAPTGITADPGTAAPSAAVTQPTATPTTQAPAVSLPATLDSLSTDQAKLDFFNSSLNRIKAQNAGFKKAKQTLGTDMTLSNALVNAVASALKDSLLPNDTTETVVNKGDSSVDIMYPPGKDYVSALTLADCSSITCEQSGANFVITVRLADATNPDKENSAYAKIFEFITVDDIMNTYAPNMNATVERENVFFDFAGCYAKATISADGTPIEYETYVNGTMRLTEGKIKGFTTDLSIVLSSTTLFTDFQW